MNPASKHFALAVSVAATLASIATAHATNGYKLIGIGAYQMGMAGAVVAAPGSAMTAITNPAGLTLADVTSQTDFSLEAFMPKRHEDFQGTGGARSESSVHLYGVPAIGWSAPTREGSSLYFGGGMYGTSGLGVDYPYTEYSPVTNPASAPSGTNPPLYFFGYSSLAIWQMAPALAWKVNDHLSLGVALDIGYLSAGFRQQLYSGSTASAQVINGVDMSRSADAFGIGATVGVLYRIDPMWTVGGAYTSAQTYKLHYNLAPGDLNVMGTPYPAGTYTLTMKTPQTAALGVAFRPISALTVSAQVKWIDWHAAMDALNITGPQDYPYFTPHWHNQTAVAVGVNYRVDPALQLRAGYDYARSPIDSSAVGYNIVMPALIESHYTAGVTYDLNHHWTVAAAYMYAPKVSRTAPAATSPTDPNQGQTIDLAEQAVSFNIGYKF